MSRDGDIRAVAAKIDALLDKLSANVAALNSMLPPPEPPAAPGQDERLVKP